MDYPTGCQYQNCWNGKCTGLHTFEEGKWFFSCFVFEVKAVSAGRRRLGSAVCFVVCKGSFYIAWSWATRVWMGFTAVSDVPSFLCSIVSGKAPHMPCGFHPWTASLGGLWRLSFITISDGKRHFSTPDVATLVWSRNFLQGWQAF